MLTKLSLSPGTGKLASSFRTTNNPQAMLYSYSTVHARVLRPFPAAQPRVGGGIHCGTFSDDLTLEDLRRQQRAFVEERDWARFHTPRSLALALVGEVGELCEVLQWRGDDGAAPGLLGWSDKDRTALTEELADVLSYVLRIADVCDIDLSTAYADKLAKNRAKYPAELVRGSSAKYTEYRQGARAQSASEASAAAAAATTPPQPAVPLPSPSPPPLEEPFDADEPYARAARRVEAQSRAYARAQKRAADKWAALQAQGRTDAMGSEKAIPASWADSGAAPASAYAGGRTGARTDESSAVAVAQEASRDESAAMSAAKAAEAEKEAEMEVQQVEKEAEMAQRIQSLRERAISRAEAQWAARQARQTRQASPTQVAGREPLLGVESLGELWAMMEFDGPPTGRETLLGSPSSPSVLPEAPEIAFDETRATTGDRSSPLPSEPLHSEPSPVVEELVVESLGELWAMMEFDGPPNRGGDLM